MHCRKSGQQKSLYWERWRLADRLLRSSIASWLFVTRLLPLFHRFTAQTYRRNTHLFHSPSLSSAHSSISTFGLSLFLISLFPFTLHLHRSYVFPFLPSASYLTGTPLPLPPLLPPLNYSSCPFNPSFPSPPSTRLDQPHSISGCMRIIQTVCYKRNSENKWILNCRYNIFQLRLVNECEAFRTPFFPPWLSTLFSKMQKQIIIYLSILVSQFTQKFVNSSYSFCLFPRNKKFSLFQLKQKFWIF